MSNESNKSWIRSGWYDSAFILSPPFLCLLLIFCFPSFFQTPEITREWLWFLLIVGIDVGHVYSTIYRTYFDKETILKSKALFYLSPLLIYIAGVLLHSINPMFFWRAMAYLAVFHFVRQQYGFLRLYARNEKNDFWKRVDSLMIYASTLYPLLYWHLQGKQLFNWFVEDDFLYFNFPVVVPILNMLYIIVLLTYLTKEAIFYFKNKQINVPKNLLILGTSLSWYFGIVYFKGDLTFTLLNVVTHGIPYFALVWAHGNKKSSMQSSSSYSILSKLFKPVNIFAFIGILLVLAYIEEMIWDGLVWKEHLQLFPASINLPDITDSPILMSILIPLLALPQLLHYFIDGFIWKLKKDVFNWSIYIK